MKLNLLPATVNKGAAARNAWIGSVVLIFVGIGAAAFMIISSKQALAQAKQEVEDALPAAARALATSQKADTEIAKAEPYLRNTRVAKAMLAHNTKYPDLYDEVRTWVPSFFRITQMTATPVDATTTRVTLRGTVDTYQQYADLPLAFLRQKDVQTVGRGQYVTTDKIVPNLTLADQQGAPRGANEQPIPKDPLERLAYFEGQTQATGYAGVSNFGAANTDTRFAMPNSSYITIDLVISRDLTVPDARSSLRGSAGAAATSAPIGGGFPGAPGAPTSGPGGGGGGGAAASDDD